MAMTAVSEISWRWRASASWPLERSPGDKAEIASARLYRADLARAYDEMGPGARLRRRASDMAGEDARQRC